MALLIYHTFCHEKVLDFLKIGLFFLNDHGTQLVVADTISLVISGDCEQYFNFTFYTNITNTF